MSKIKNFGGWGRNLRGGFKKALNRAVFEKALKARKATLKKLAEAKKMARKFGQKCMKTKKDSHHVAKISKIRFNILILLLIYHIRATVMIYGSSGFQNGIFMLEWVKRIFSWPQVIHLTFAIVLQMLLQVAYLAELRRGDLQFRPLRPFATSSVWTVHLVLRPSNEDDL